MDTRTKRRKREKKREKKRKRKKWRNKQGKTCFRKLGKSKRLRDGLPLPQIKVPALYQCRFIEEMILLHSCLLHVLQHHHVQFSKQTNCQLIHPGQHNTQHQLHLQHSAHNTYSTHITHSAHNSYSTHNTRSAHNSSSTHNTRSTCNTRSAHNTS